MNKKLIEKVAGGLTLSVIAIAMAATPVFADTEVNTFIRENSYTRKPQGYISLIDPTNNQLEVMITEMNLGGALNGLDIGWVTDDIWRDPRVYTLEADYAQGVFSADGDLAEYYIGTNGVTRKYRVNTEVELKDNPYDQLFLIIRLDTGVRMVGAWRLVTC